MALRNALLISNMFFFGLTALAFIASILTFFLTRANERAKDRELAQYQSKAALEVKQATLHASEAIAKGISLDADAAKTRERTAQLEKATAESRERTAILEQKTAEISSRADLASKIAETANARTQWRTLSDDQIARMKNVLNRVTGGKVFIVTDNDEESRNYASLIFKCFQEAGWHVADGFQMSMDRSRAEVAILLGDGPDSQAVAAAFKAADIPFVRTTVQDLDVPPLGITIHIADRHAH